MSAVVKQKAALRKAIRERIRGLDPGTVRISNEAIYRQVVECLDEYERACTLFCFVGAGMEIDTIPIIVHALKAGKIVAVPLCIGEGLMEARRISSLNELATGAYGILAPAESCIKIEPAEIDLAIVPCLACDRNGNRLGQGGGYYDRFLSTCSFPSIALCREAFLLDAIPVESWDKTMMAVVSENGVEVSLPHVTGKPA